MHVCIYLGPIVGLIYVVFSGRSCVMNDEGRLHLPGHGYV